MMPDVSQGDSARGRFREVRMDLDEVPESDAYLWTIHVTGWCFYFMVPTWDRVKETLAFFRSHHGTQVLSTMVVGTFINAPVRLIKDSEFEDRFWLRTGQDGQMCDFTLCGDLVIAFMDQLSSIVAEKYQPDDPISR
jgi:hypothetical protein